MANSNAVLATTNASNAPLKKPREVTFSHRRVAAPMVGCSDLAFRLLCRKYGADLCYTEMLDASRFVSDPAYATALFWSQLLPAGADARDRPLVVQFSGRDPDTLVAAARLVQAHVDAVDFNLGCPQQRAKDDGCATLRVTLVVFYGPFSGGRAQTQTKSALNVRQVPLERSACA